MTLNRNSIVVRWAYLFESVPRATNLCPFFWRCVLWTPMKILFVLPWVFVGKILDPIVSKRLAHKTPEWWATFLLKWVYGSLFVLSLALCLFAFGLRAFILVGIVVVATLIFLGVAFLVKEGLGKAYMLAKRVGLCPLIQIK